MKGLFTSMVATLLVGLSTLPALSSLGQSPTITTTIVYKAPTLSINVFDKDKNLVAEANLGRDVYIVVDTFFRSYEVRYTEVSGKQRIAKYRFSKKEDSINMLRMKDNHDEIFYLRDLLKDGVLLIVQEKEASRPDGSMHVLIVEDAERTYRGYYNQ